MGGAARGRGAGGQGAGGTGGGAGGGSGTGGPWRVADGGEGQNAAGGAERGGNHRGRLEAVRKRGRVQVALPGDAGDREQACRPGHVVVDRRGDARVLGRGGRHGGGG